MAGTHQVHRGGVTVRRDHVHPEPGGDDGEQPDTRAEFRTAPPTPGRPRRWVPPPEQGVKRLHRGRARLY